LWNQPQPDKSAKGKMDNPKHPPIISESYANPDNELFTKLHEDPLVAIMKEEQRQKDEVKSNPIKMKEIENEIKTILTVQSKVVSNEESHHHHHHHHRHSDRHRDMRRH